MVVLFVAYCSFPHIFNFISVHLYHLFFQFGIKMSQSSKRQSTSSSRTSSASSSASGPRSRPSSSQGQGQTRPSSSQGQARPATSSDSRGARSRDSLLKTVSGSSQRTTSKTSKKKDDSGAVDINPAYKRLTQTVGGGGGTYQYDKRSSSGMRHEDGQNYSSPAPVHSASSTQAGTAKGKTKKTGLLSKLTQSVGGKSSPKTKKTKETSATKSPPRSAWETMDHQVSSFTMCNYFVSASFK